MNRLSLTAALLLATSLTALPLPAVAQAPLKQAPAVQQLPTGQSLTPLAVPGARFSPLVARTGPKPETVADGASAISVSPDGRRMLVLTSGYNRVNGADGAIIPEQSVQYVFVYALDGKGSRWLQTLTVPNSYSGVSWAPDGKRFAVAGGVDDTLHTFVLRGSRFAAQGAPIALGHAVGIGADVKPQAAGVAISPDGKRALVANYYNDSVSLVDLQRRIVIAERDLRPGKNDPAMRGVAGGEFPFAVVWRDGARAYVSAPRDREVIALAIGGTSLTITSRIATIGEPTALLVDAKRQRLYATEDNDDRLAVIDTATDRLIGEQRLGLPDEVGAGPLAKGLNPNALALLPDGRLLVTYGGINAVAVVAEPGPEGRVEAVLPTGWYPSAVATSRKGDRLYIANRKSPPGPNPLGCAPQTAVTQAQPQACGAANQYIYQLEKAGLLEFPMPATNGLADATLQVASNIGLGNREARAHAEAELAALRPSIKHVVFIVKENRTYDQVLGDLPVGNGDPTLAILGKRLSPNHHALALGFVTLDNFLNSGEQSSTGWTWTTAARVPDLLEKTAPVGYARRGLAYEAEGQDRNLTPAQSQVDRRRVNPQTPDDDDVLPGSALLTAPDADGDDEGDRGAGFLWNAALRAGLTVRNYGFADATVYDVGAPGAVPPIRTPFADGRKVWTPTDRALAPHSDLYFSGFDQKLPDYWRVLEWEREFAQQESAGSMPALTLLRLSHDHFGDFAHAIDGVNTVETQMADNDYALGRVIERIAGSRFKDSTAIFVIEDDAQNGADHVDARRSIALIAGAHVKQSAVVSTRYTTVSMLRTIGALLGLPPLGLNDSLAVPMADVFQREYRDWSFTARAAQVLKRTALPIPADRFVPADAQQAACIERSPEFWTAAMQGQNFAGEDRLDTDAFNAALWHGLAGSVTPASAQPGGQPGTPSPCPRLK